MRKSKVIEQVAARCGITASESEKYLNTFFRLVYEVLAKDDEVNISGFGKFRTYDYKGRIGINPRTLAKNLVIKPRRIPKFTPGEAFKRAVAIKK